MDQPQSVEGCRYVVLSSIALCGNALFGAFIAALPCMLVAGLRMVVANESKEVVERAWCRKF